jgi:hypothetical protein
MTAVNDLAAGRISPGNHAAHYRPVSRANFCFHLGVQNNLFSCAQACAQCFRRVPRNHESEACRLACIQMAPTHNGSVQARPCRGLIWHVAHNACCPVLDYGERLYPSQYAIGQHNLSAHILAGVIGLVRSVAYIHQGSFHIGAVTVVSQPDRISRPVSQKQMLWPHFPQLTGLDRPSEIRPHQSVLRFSVDGKLLALDFGQSVLTRASQNELSGLIEFGRRGHAMEAGQITQIFVRRRAVGLIAQLYPLFRREKRLLRKRERCSRQEKERAEN